MGSHTKENTSMRRNLLRALCGLAVAALLCAQTASVVTRQGFPQAYGGPYDVYYVALPTTLTSVDARASHILEYCVFNNSGSSITLTIQTQDATPLPLPYTGSIATGVTYCFTAGDIGMPVNGWSIKGSATGAYYSATWTH